jgi:hypothetical protein
LIDGLAVALVLHIYCGEHQTPYRRSENTSVSRLSDLPLSKNQQLPGLVVLTSTPSRTKPQSS